MWCSWTSTMPMEATKSRMDLASILYFQHFSRLSHTRRRSAIFAGGHAGKRDQLTPAESRTRSSKFFARGAIIFLGMERAVFADGIAEQKIKDRTRRVAKFAIAA